MGVRDKGGSGKFHEFQHFVRQLPASVPGPLQAAMEIMPCFPGVACLCQHGPQGSCPPKTGTVSLDLLVVH